MENKHNFLLILDAGHGGKDPGCIKNNIKEKELNLSLQSRIIEYIINYRFDIDLYLTRKSDYYLSLKQRCDFTNERFKYYKNGLFLSIHHNSSISESASGFEAHYYEYSKLGIEIAAIFNINFKKMGILTRENKSSNFHVLKHTQPIALILELGFMSNKKELDKLNNILYQDKEARAIINALYFIINGEA